MVRPRTTPLRLSALVPCLVLMAPGAAFAQSSASSPTLPSDPRTPGTLDKAYESLVGDGTDLQVVEPRVEEPRPEDPPPPPPDTLGEWRLSARPFIEQLGRVDLAEVGTVDVRRAGLDFIARRPGERQRELSLEFDFESATYEFGDAGGLVPASFVPVEDVLWSRVGAGWRGPQDRRWSWTAGLGVSAAAEQDAALEESLMFGGFAQTRYRVDDDFATVVGLMARTGLEDDDLLIPVLGVDWRIDDRTKLETLGPSLRLERELDQGSSIFSNLAYRNREYRLDGKGPLPGGSFTDEELRLVAGLDWHPGLEEWGPLQSSSAQLYFGTTLWREVSFHSDSEQVSKTSVDPAWILGVSVRLRF
ncbi:hypothetical protein [Engelhardtia mirabilis]|uniref:Uncharacterized protein n=1 Tax=Engelhardtia mirabilis TaxID=2528011 RepID=A0A518BDK1_9BACT|nr:hypothetical protein Pla133_01090 [Planctomycetes bacterium Pla133]QDU99372.1 hypothetical protein Pla86_01090 [Planctomycetes bacterium Pla86]